MGGKKDRLGRRKDLWGKTIKLTVTVNLIELFQCFVYDTINVFNLRNILPRQVLLHVQ